MPARRGFRCQSIKSLFLKKPSSSYPEVLCKKGVLRNFTKITGKQLCQSLFFVKVTGLRPINLSKKRLWHRCFPVNFVKLLRSPFHIEHLWWLLLKKAILLIFLAKYLALLKLFWWLELVSFFNGCSVLFLSNNSLNFNFESEG